jgi:hypothetical protein
MADYTNNTESGAENNYYQDES